LFGINAFLFEQIEIVPSFFQHNKPLPEFWFICEALFEVLPLLRREFAIQIGSQQGIVQCRFHRDIIQPSEAFSNATRPA
jgi:hypothetical protein